MKKFKRSLIALLIYLAVVLSHSVETAHVTIAQALSLQDTGVSHHQEDREKNEKRLLIRTEVDQRFYDRLTVNKKAKNK